MADGRPVPPPKPMHYQPSSGPWRHESDGRVEPGYSQTQPNGIHNVQSNYISSKRFNSSNMDLTGGPPPYYSTTKDHPPNTRAPGIPPNQDVPTSYANHPINSPLRR